MNVNDTVLFLHGPMVYDSRQFLSGLSAYAAEHGLSVHELIPPQGANAAFLERIIAFWQPLGIVATFGHDKGIPLPSPEVRTPFVCIDLDPGMRCRIDSGPFSRLGFINCDSEHIALFAARTLLARDFAGYAYVSHTEHHHWSETRRQCFREALELNGKTCLEFDGAGLANCNVDQSRRFRKWLASLPRPCGLLAANDRTAYQVLTNAAIENIAVPDELSVIGIDNDITLCETVSPPLSSIQVDFWTGGYVAGRLVQQLNRGKGRQTVEARYGAQEFVARLSSRKLAASSASIRAALETIRRQVTDGVTAADILPILGGSRRTAEKRFRAAVGKSILEEILDVRFERLFPLLEAGEVPLGLLAGKTGFSSENHLQRLFKSRYGMTLSAYRKKHLSTVSHGKTG